MNSNKRSGRNEVYHVNFKENEQVKNWIVLDRLSIVDLFYNSDLVKNITEVDEEMHVVKNSGLTINNHQAEMTQYGELWYNEEAITNIFSLKEKN